MSTQNEKHNLASWVLMKIIHIYAENNMFLTFNTFWWIP